jgi:hypothetical protein
MELSRVSHLIFANSLVVTNNERVRRRLFLSRTFPPPRDPAKLPDGTIARLIMRGSAGQD